MNCHLDKREAVVHVAEESIDAWLCYRHWHRYELWHLSVGGTLGGFLNRHGTP